MELQGCKLGKCLGTSLRVLSPAASSDAVYMSMNDSSYFLQARFNSQSVIKSPGSFKHFILLRGGRYDIPSLPIAAWRVSQMKERAENTLPNRTSPVVLALGDLCSAK